MSARKPAPSRKPSSQKAPLYRSMYQSFTHDELGGEIGEPVGAENPFTRLLASQEAEGYVFVSASCIASPERLLRVDLLLVFRRRAR